MGSGSSREAVGVVAGFLEKASEMFEESKDELGKLDSIASDGGHGIETVNGPKTAAQAARAITDQSAGVVTTLSTTGDVRSDRAGGTSGALWGSLLTAIGVALGNKEALSLDSITDVAIAGRSAVQRLGSAQVGNKMMIDTLIPLVDTFVLTDGDLKAEGEAAVAADRTGAESTVQLVAKLDRARSLGEKSLGTPNPGVVSLVWAVKAAVEQI